MFNITICWDNIEQAKVLSKYLTKFSIDKEFNYNLYTFNNLNELINENPKHIDILFFYIELTDKDMISTTLQTIKSMYNDIQIIFIPEIINFMINGFSLKDFPYILQPLKYESFEDEMTTCAKNLKVNMDKPYNSLINGISTKSILYIEYNDNTCTIYTNISKFDMPCDKDYINKISGFNYFFRCNDNCIVNLKKISKIGKYFVIVNSKKIDVDIYKFKELKHKLLIMLNLL